MATNRADTLDPALLRPGRLDRKIEFPLPDRRQKRLVFQVCVGVVGCCAPDTRARARTQTHTHTHTHTRARARTQVCTSKMNLGDEVDLEDYVSRPDKISAAEISAICQEAGMHAVRSSVCVWREGWVRGCACGAACVAAAVAEVCVRPIPDPLTPSPPPKNTHAHAHGQVRKNRYVILPKDFEKGYKANVKKSGDEFAFYQ
jgi:SpoVK/Ycf46/Vps4 family AAA+-type ATPase